MRYHHDFVTRELGVKSEEVVYKEDVWSGGGNAGPDLETIVRGLELATLVFMKFKVENGEFVELPIRTVDTGYGIERYTWLSQGSLSCFHSVYGPILDETLGMASIKIDAELLETVAELSGIMSLEKVVDRKAGRKRVARQLGVNIEELKEKVIPVENVFATLDHTKCLLFLLAEGVIPSNLGEGYLTRLMLRRTYRLLRILGIEKQLADIVDSQIIYWSQDFPRLQEMRDEILEILLVEEKKFKKTLRRGQTLVKRRIRELSKPSEGGEPQIPTDMLIEFYDSHGLPPEIVQETAKKEGFEVEVPENFYSMVAEKHEGAPLLETERKEKLESRIPELPETRKLYYEDPYLRRFEAKVIQVLDDESVVLDKTAFYPEGGGQPADQGHLRYNDSQSEIVNVQKIGKIIVHTLKGGVPEEGDLVEGVIDWERRSRLMKHHTATHILMGAARRVLGEHVWQAGSQKDTEKARLDISHFRRLTLEEVHQIEELANQVVIGNIPVETSWMPRGEAERRYGFRLYQGGVVPGKKIRVVKTGEWEVEACGGTHLKNTGETGFIKIVHTERIQDGVERIVFSAGLSALKAVQQDEKLLWQVSEVLNAPREKLEKTAKRLVREWKEVRRENEALKEEIVARDRIIANKLQEAEMSLEDRKALRDMVPIVEDREIDGVRLLIQKIEGRVDVDRMIMTANEYTKSEPRTVAVVYGTNKKTVSFVVMSGKEALGLGVDCGQIAEEAASLLGGGGGGRKEFAQGGGTRVDEVLEALEKIKDIISRQLREEQ